MGMNNSMDMNSNNKDAFGLPLVIPSYEPDEKLLRLLADLGTAGFRNIIIVDD